MQLSIVKYYYPFISTIISIHDIYIYIIITTPILYDKLTNQDTSGPFEVWEAHPDFFERAGPCPGGLAARHEALRFSVPLTRAPGYSMGFTGIYWERSTVKILISMWLNGVYVELAGEFPIVGRQQKRTSRAYFQYFALQYNATILCHIGLGSWGQRQIHVCHMMYIYMYISRCIILDYCITILYMIRTC